MAISHYLSASGSDTTGDGTENNPWRTNAKANSEMPVTLEEAYTRYLDGAVDDEDTYDPIIFKNVQCIGEASITVQPKIWIENNYQAATDPFVSVSPGALDVDGAKPCAIVMQGGVAIDIGCGVRNVRICGVAVRHDAGVVSRAISVDEASRAAFVYCRIESTGVGLQADDGSNAQLENCYLSVGLVGAAASDRSTLTLIGDNLLRECGVGGVLATNGSAIDFKPWANFPRVWYTTTIDFSGPRARWAAIAASGDSRIHLIDRTMNIGDPTAAQVKVLNRNLHPGAEVYGVFLQSRSLLLNRDRLSFTDPDINDGKPTIPDGQQVVLKPDEECIALG